MSFAPDLASPEWVDPTERCPDCGGEMTRGAECCRACDRKREEYEINTDVFDPRF